MINRQNSWGDLFENGLESPHKCTCANCSYSLINIIYKFLDIVWNWNINLDFGINDKYSFAMPFCQICYILQSTLWLCPSSKALSESTWETCVINSAPILIIQLCRFSNQGGQLLKDKNFFSCTQSESNKHLLLPITVEDYKQIFFNCHY